MEAINVSVVKIVKSFRKKMQQLGSSKYQPFFKESHFNILVVMDIAIKVN